MDQGILDQCGAWGLETLFQELSRDLCSTICRDLAAEK